MAFYSCPQLIFRVCVRVPCFSFYIKTAFSIGTTKIIPSPFLPVWAFCSIAANDDGLSHLVVCRDLDASVWLERIERIVGRSQPLAKTLGVDDGHAGKALDVLERVYNLLNRERPNYNDY